MAFCMRNISKLQSFFINRTIFRSKGMSAQRQECEDIELLKERNEFYKKYAEKINRLQESKPDEFRERINKVVNPVKADKIQTRTYAELLNPKAPKKATEIVEPETPYKKLSDIMKIDLIADKSAEELSNIWLAYHKTKDVLAATLTVQQFDDLMRRAKQYPLFLLPLPRSEGFEFIMLQFAANAVHFTSLLAYQVHAENAPECLTITHYTETKEKGIVLMRGEYDKKVLTGQEAQCLANELQMFYCRPDDAKLSLLETFNKKPEDFKHMDLIKEVENIQLI